MSKCAILFSGGTDSLCSASLAAEKFSEVHLLTFYEQATASSPWPKENVERLKKHYPQCIFKHSVYSTDEIVKKLSYDEYFKNILKFGFYNLSTTGISSLSWHIRTILYCRENQISTVYDGMTAELLHLPGHMPEIRSLFSQMYSYYGIEFSSPVINWDVPTDQRFMDKLIVDRHGFTEVKNEKKRTTGQWLFDKGILPHPNIKGSEFDRLMQHDCYPFVVYNMLVFWFFEPIMGYEKFKLGLARFMQSKIEKAQNFIDTHLQNSKEFSFLNSVDENI